MHEQSEKFNKEIEIILKKGILQLKSKMNAQKSYTESFNSRVYEAEERISELEDR